MIVLRNLSFARAAKPLVEDASLQLGPGWKVGLTGGNGSGKSSFFALLTGKLHAERGDLELPPSWVIAHVAQETPALPDPALEFVLDGDNELRQVERALAEAEAEAAHDHTSSASETSIAGAEGSPDSWRGNPGGHAGMTHGEHIGTLHARLSEIDGYSARARAAELLHGLGFSDADLGRPVAEFSGGWRVRLNLARALMCRSDLLLLDEPTNHLDLDAVLWLEGWLRAYRGTLLMISHDRDFLDAVVSHILHIEQGGMKLYTGHYTAFERQRAAKLALQQSMFEKQQREIAHLHRFIDRFRAKATKARQAQSRMKALERMEEVAAAHVDTPFTFRFRDPAAAPDPLLVLHRARGGYPATAQTTAGSKIILDGIELTLRPGERIALLGRNGAGKSTLVKLLAAEMAPLAGERTEGKGLAIGYFAQHQLEHLRPDESPLQHMARLDPQTREQELRDYLGGFDFRGDMANAPCGKFSGGEKSRLALALLIWKKPNLLLLDEPTNHLDLEMREALTLALNEYEGGVVLVSHDRHLLRTTADTLLLVADGKVAPFDGDLDDYAGWLATQRDAAKAPAVEVVADKAARKEAREQAAAERQALLARRRPLLKEGEQLDKKLAAWHQEKAALDEELADPAIYTAPDRAGLEAKLKRQGQLASDVAAAEERWLEVQMELESLAESAG